MNRVYTVVENAGYERETDILSFPTFREASAFTRKQYDHDEIDTLHVMIRTDFEDGTQEY